MAGEYDIYKKKNLNVVEVRSDRIQLMKTGWSLQIGSFDKFACIGH